MNWIGVADLKLLFYDSASFMSEFPCLFSDLYFVLRENSPDFRYFASFQNRVNIKISNIYIFPACKKKKCLQVWNRILR